MTLALRDSRTFKVIASSPLFINRKIRHIYQYDLDQYLRSSIRKLNTTEQYP